MVDEQKRLAEVRERMSVLEDLIAKKRCSLQALRDEYKALDTEALQLEIEIQMAESGVSPDDTPAGYDPHEEEIIGVTISILIAARSSSFMDFAASVGHINSMSNLHNIQTAQTQMFLTFF